MHTGVENISYVKTNLKKKIKQKKLGILSIYLFFKVGVCNCYGHFSPTKMDCGSNFCEMAAILQESYNFVNPGNA